MDRTAKKKVNTGKFDPSKRYQWEEEDMFTISGREIDAINRAINAQINTPEFQRMLAVQQAAITMQNFLKECVEQGVIKEAALVEDKKNTLHPVGPEEASKNGQEEAKQAEEVSEDSVL